MQCLHLIEKGYCNLEWLKKSKQKNVMLDNGLAICHPLLSNHETMISFFFPFPGLQALVVMNRTFYKNQYRHRMHSGKLPA